jgi:hypothetical protein
MQLSSKKTLTTRELRRSLEEAYRSLLLIMMKVSVRICFTVSVSM